METMNCKNCQEPLQGAFCHHCGQRASTKRFSGIGLLSVDLLLGLFSFERSKFLRTTKRFLLNPGTSGRAYLSGQRVEYFHFLTYLIIIITINEIALANLNIDYLEGLTEEQVNTFQNYFNFANQNFRLSTLIKIPIGAVLTFLLFRKSGYNFAEHLVLNCFLISIEWMIRFPFHFLDIGGLPNLGNLATWAPRVFAIFFFYQTFHVFYSHKWQVLLLSILTMFLVIVAYAMLFVYPTIIWLEQ